MNKYSNALKFVGGLGLCSAFVFAAWHASLPKVPIHSASSSMSSMTLGITKAELMRPITSSRIQSAIQKADVVIVGIVTVTHPQGIMSISVNGRAVEFQKYQAIVNVSAVYKGKAKTNDYVTVNYSTSLQSEDTLEPSQGKPFLYFLKFGTDKQLDFVYADFFNFPVMENRPDMEANWTTQSAVEAELLQNIAHGKEDLILKTIRVLRCNPQAMALCKTSLAQNNSLMVRAEAIAYRIKCGQSEALSDAIDIIQTARQEGNQTSVATKHNVIVTVSMALEDMIPSLTTKQLKLLLDLKVDEVDHFIASALCEQSHEKQRAEVAFAMIEILKRSKDLQTQYDALTPLSYLRDVPGPGGDEFVKNPQEYVREYISWWEREGGKKYGDKKIPQ